MLYQRCIEAHHVAEHKCHGGGKHQLVSGWELIPEATKNIVNETMLSAGLSLPKVIFLIKAVEAAVAVYAASGRRAVHSL